MIIELCQEIATELTNLERVKQSEGDARAIELTRNRLDELKTGTSKLYKKCFLLKSKLANIVIESIITGVAKLHDQLKISQQNFYSGGIYSQASELDKLKNELKLLNDKLDENWSTQYKRETKLLETRLKLVRYLPSIDSQKDELAKAFEELKLWSKKPPATEAELKRYDLGIQILGKVLQATEGLEPSVITFLEKVSDGKATLADLDDETLQWCKDKNRVHSFMIMFSS